MNNEKLDTVFSLMVRKKAANEDGIYYCYVCGKAVFWKHGVVLHYIKRRFLHLRWDERNVKPGCSECNRKDEEDKNLFMLKIIQNEGIEEMNWLIENRFKQVKITQSDKQEMFNKFTKNLKQ